MLRSVSAGASAGLTARKRSILDAFDREAGRRPGWRRKAAFFHGEDDSYLGFLIPPGLRILEIGCGTGNTLAALAPSFGVGLDFSPSTVAEARAAHPGLQFHLGDAEDPDIIASLPGPFDVILIVDTIGFLDDVQGLFERLHPLCTRETRLVVAYYSHLWRPLLRLAEGLGLRMRQPEPTPFRPPTPAPSRSSAASTP